MNQDDLARRIVARLDQQLARLPDGVAGRLAQVRRRALQVRSQPSPVYLRFSEWIVGHRAVLGVWLPALFVLATVGTIVFLQSAETPDPFDIETALLADELPIHAYTDPGFDAWLRHTSHEQQQ